MAEKQQKEKEYDALKRLQKYVDMDLKTNSVRCDMDFSKEFGTALQDYLNRMQEGKSQTKREVIRAGMLAFEKLEEELSKSTGKHVIFSTKFYTPVIYDYWKNESQAFLGGLNDLIKGLLKEKLTEKLPEENEYNPIKELQENVDADIENNFKRYGIDFSREFGIMLRSYLTAVRGYGSQTEEEVIRAGDKTCRKLKRLLKKSVKKSVSFENTKKCWPIIYDQSKKQNKQFLEGLDNYINLLLTKTDLKKLQESIRKDININQIRYGIDFSAEFGKMLQSYLTAIQKYKSPPKEKIIRAGTAGVKTLEEKLSKSAGKPVALPNTRVCGKTISQHYQNQHFLDELNALITKLLAKTEN